MVKLIFKEEIIRNNVMLIAKCLNASIITLLVQYSNANNFNILG